MMNVKVIINDVEYGVGNNEGVVPRSLLISHQVNQRSYANFTLITDLNVKIEKTSIVEIKNGNETLFKGIINAVRDKGDKIAQQRWHEISCMDNHYFVDKRIYAKAFVQEKTGDIVKALIDDVLHEEGITYDAASIQDGTSTSIVFNYQYCDNVMEKLAERSGYVWWVDNNKKLYFQDPTTVRNSNAVTDSIIKYGSLTLENDRSKFRNLQYIKGAMEITEDKTTLVRFDGTNTNFTMELPLGELIGIRMKYAGETEWRIISSVDIGKKNEDEPRPFMWAQGDNAITVDRNSLMTGDEIEFTYKGLIPIIGLSKNQQQVEELKLLEGGSGKVEHISTEPELMGALSAIQSANAKNQKYGRLDQMSMMFTTLETGYDSGELVLVNLPTEEINEDFLIERVEIYEENNMIWSDVTCVKGNIFESWARVFQKALEKNDTATQDELKLEENVVIAKDYSKIWQETDNPNPFNVLYPGSSTFPSLTTYPGFTKELRMNKAEITVNGTTNEVTKSNYIDGDSLLTLFYVNPSELNGQWTNIKFYGESDNDDILLDNVTVDFIKNERESVQIQRTEIKGWN